MVMDFHLHTLVSDGELDPVSLLERAHHHGISHLAITDHDSLGAYGWHGGAVFTEAARLGLQLTPGIEMDADWGGVEVHLLGFGVALGDASLNSHLGRVRQARFERARREIEVVNRLLGAGSVTEQDVFAPGRETLMKPHFIHPLLRRNRFASYEQANAWYRQNVKTDVRVPKPALGEAIELVHGARGWTALAHPAYYERDGKPIRGRLPALRELGLDGVELDYPYHACSPHQFTREAEAAFIGALRREALGLGLRASRGSDCHTAQDFARVYGSA